MSSVLWNEARSFSRAISGPGLSRPAGFARIAGVSPLRGSLFSGYGTQRLRAGLIYVAAPRLAVSARFEGFLRWCFQIFQPRQSLFSEFFSFTSSPSQLFLLNSFYFLPSSFLLFSVFPLSPSQLFPLSTLPPLNSSPLNSSPSQLFPLSTLPLSTLPPALLNLTHLWAAPLAQELR